MLDPHSHGLDIRLDILQGGLELLVQALLLSQDLFDQGLVEGLFLNLDELFVLLDLGLYALELRLIILAINLGDLLNIILEHPLLYPVLLLWLLAL